VTLVGGALSPRGGSVRRHPLRCHPVLRSSIPVGVLVAVAGLSLSLQGRGALDRLAAAPRINILLVTIDTLRADKVGAYGAKSPATPVMDRLAREGVLFEQATVQVPLTRPSHVSILTGKYPFAHGIRDNFSFPLAPAHRTVAELLKAQGYVTGGFIGAFMLNRQSGLGRGFDEFDDTFDGDVRTSVFLAEYQRRAAAVEARAGPWIERVAGGDRPFFAWVHFYDPHSPYDPPPPYNGRYAKSPYDGEVGYTDEILGRLLARLDRLRVRDRTLVVVTSDHGEGLGDHAEAEHGFFVYDSVLRVPLILRLPGILPAGIRARAQARSIDLLPTILDLAGAAASTPHGLPGQSLLPAIKAPDGTSADSVSYGETLFPRLHFESSDLRSIRVGGWKYIEAPRPELYDLTRDPGERANLYAGDTLRARSLRSRLFDTLGGSPESAVVGVAAPRLDPETLRKLASLGYVTGTGGAAVNSIDPKDTIAEFQAYTRGVRSAFEAYDRGDLQTAISLFQSTVSSGRADFDVHYYLGCAYARLGRFQEAVGPLREAIRKMPAYTPSYLDLAKAYVALNRYNDAAAVLNDGLARDPDNFQLHSHLGYVARIRRDLDLARQHYERASALEPADFDVRMNLSSVYRDLGDTSHALAEVDAALRLRPDSGDAHNQRGMLLGGAGRFGDAEVAFERAAKLLPQDPQIWFNLGLARFRAGNGKAAAEAVRRALALKPDFDDARNLLAAIEKQ
jgi:arylsulfatase A-like enzyme/tetratricopeptide (TPR) repeat protein